MKQFALVPVLIAASLLLSPAAQSGGAAPVQGDRAYHFGFKKSRNGQPASIDQEGFKPLLERYDAIFLGSGARKALYLTFDNGYENGYTARILDVLKDRKVPAAFFVTGHYVRTAPELLRRMADEGHLIGNHSWSHPDLTALPEAQIRDELDRVAAEVARLTGQKRMMFLRPPRGIFSERTLAVGRKSGYIHVFWSIAYKDWETGRQRGADYAFRQVTEQLHPGAVILLHAVSRDNAEALGAIIDEARRRGYTFERLDQALLE